MRIKQRLETGGFQLRTIDSQKIHEYVEQVKSGTLDINDVPEVYLVAVKGVIDNGC